MTSLRQIESNRRNAQKSTGPKTDSGKHRASRNAVRRGLTAETVIKLLEDPEDYQAFELAVTTDYDAESAVERELVLRLASLLWRLRRATSIETGLLQVQYENLPQSEPTPQPRSAQNSEVIAIFRSAARTQSSQAWNEAERVHEAPCGKEDRCSESMLMPREPEAPELARRFLRLADLDNGAFERLGRYEATLWRHVRQTIFTLEALRWRAPSARTWRTRDRWQGADRSSSDTLKEFC
jgi:hypothetical protein